MLILWLICGAGIAYLIVALFAVIRFGRRRISRATATQGVTILKPIHGLEPELFENLCSFCDQEYPQFQVIFGTRRLDDPALDVVRRVIERFPDRDLALVINDSASSGNPKVANLKSMIAAAKHDLLFIADADMRVDRTYLASVSAEFSDERVGAVTCLYAGVPRAGFASELAALQLNDQFAPSVLVATIASEPQFCFGSTMAVRRQALGAIGGTDALAPHLADDYMLGSLVAERGYRVVLSRYVVSTVELESNLVAVVQRELRWARTIRSVRPAGYALSFVTYPLPFALVLPALSGGSTATWILLAVVSALRLAIHYAMRRSFDLGARPNAWLIPLRDVLGLAVWVAGFFGNTVRWRGQTIAVAKGAARSEQ